MKRNIVRVKDLAQLETAFAGWITRIAMRKSVSAVAGIVATALKCTIQTTRSTAFIALKRLAHGFNAVNATDGFATSASDRKMKIFVIHVTTSLRGKI